MGTAKKHARQARRMQTRTKTRGTKTINPADPEANNALLSSQLHAMGLYAVETLGDGNCLFRALSDQVYGTPSYHHKLRSDISDWIQAHKERYEPFVEDERGFDVHLANMRQHGTYGGHMELSAFAHLTRRNVKVIQPGLVYIIECDTGDSPGIPQNRRRMSKSRVSDLDDGENNFTTNGTVYVAYHDWEHFSSVRNISGPHQGLPTVVETPAPPKTPPITLRIPRRSLNPPPIRDLAAIALPRSVSPSSQDSSHLTSESSSSLLTPDDSMPSSHTAPMRHSPSPKRTLEESDADCLTEAETYRDKKHKSDQPPSFLEPLDEEPLSELSSAVSTPPPESDVPTPPHPVFPPGLEDTPVKSSKPLTRRQRKALGLPKSRAATAGKIVIPGGKHPLRHGKGWVIVSEDEEDPSNSFQRQEWMKNGNGRLDVRGFKELKI